MALSLLTTCAMALVARPTTLVGSPLAAAATRVPPVAMLGEDLAMDTMLTLAARALPVEEFLPAAELFG